MVRVARDPSEWACLVLGAKEINLVSGRVITPLSMALQSIDTSTSARL